jgi:hypothetical protein
MNKIILFLFLISCGFAEEGHWVYEDGWVLKKEDASAGGAIIQNKTTDRTIVRQNDTLIKETFRNKESNDLLKGLTATRNGVNTPTLFVIPILCSPSKSELNR